MKNQIFLLIKKIYDLYNINNLNDDIYNNEDYY